MKAFLAIIFLILGVSVGAAEAQVVTGSSITLSVTVGEGTPPFTYQWQKDGVDIVGATSATYVVVNVAPQHAGNYTVKVANKAGSTLSDTASVTIIVKPAKVTTLITTATP